ncbi:MAG: RNA-guided endonuclease IscB [Chloroflexi bacterium]|nr:RNA-guided endonuclease IscB [Chloroflexota bacterium]
MHYTNYQPTPVYSSDYEPLMPCHPARARKLLRNGRAAPHHVRGIFGIRLLDRSRAQCEVQDTSLNVDAGSDISGFAVVQDDDNGQRTVLALVELRHRAKAIKSTMTGRSQHRRSRRGRLRHRAPRFNNRRREPGTLPPSVDSIHLDAMRVVSTMCRIYPVSRFSIERYKFDTQLMNNPDIRGVEYQRGTLFGWQVRAYIFNRDQGRCVYCRRRNVRLELDHIRPRAIGSDRVDNLVTCCRDCNLAKANRPIEEFLADRPELLTRILDRLQRSDLASAAHINTALPAIVRDLWTLGRPISSANAASVSWKRRQLNMPKNHCYDAALQGQDFSAIVSLPSRILVLRPNNGRSKQKANVDRHGTPIGRPFREHQRLPKRLRRRRNPAPGHAGHHQRHGAHLISTGDTVTLEHHAQQYTGRAVIKSGGTRVAIHGTKPEISAQISQCRRIARNPRWTIRHASPAQQSHQASTVK